MRERTLKYRSATHLGFVVYDSWADGTILILGQGLANFFFKGPDSKYFRFAQIIVPAKDPKFSQFFTY